LLDASVGIGGNRMQASAPDGAVVAAFLHWTETLDGDVEMTAKPMGPSYHLTATGTTAGVPLTILMIVRGNEYATLHQELTGHAPVEVPLTRSQLAKIADPELLDDRAAVTP
jgi:hypothetical protein